MKSVKALKAGDAVTMTRGWRRSSSRALPSRTRSQPPALPPTGLNRASRRPS